MGDDETEDFLLGQPADSFGPTEIAKATGRPKQTVYSHLKRLLKRKSVLRVSPGRYGVLSATKVFFETYLIIPRATDRAARSAKAWLSKRFAGFVLLACGISLLSGLRILQLVGLMTTTIPTAYLFLVLYGLTFAVLLEFLPVIVMQVLLKLLVRSLRGYCQAV
jgi:hypothetical protein